MAKSKTYFYVMKDESGNEIARKEITLGYFVSFNQKMYESVYPFNQEREYFFLYPNIDKENAKGTESETVVLLSKSFGKILELLAAANRGREDKKSKRNLKRLKKLYQLEVGSGGYKFPCFEEKFADTSRVQLRMLWKKEQELKDEDKFNAILEQAQYNVWVDLDKLVRIFKEKLYIRNSQEEIEKLMIRLMHGLYIRDEGVEVCIFRKSKKKLRKNQNFVKYIVKEYCATFDTTPGSINKGVENLYKLLREIKDENLRQILLNSILDRLEPIFHEWEMYLIAIKGREEEALQLKIPFTKEMAVELRYTVDENRRWTAEWPQYDMRHIRIIK